MFKALYGWFAEYYYKGTVIRQLGTPTGAVRYVIIKRGVKEDYMLSYGLWFEVSQEEANFVLSMVDL